MRIGTQIPPVSSQTPKVKGSNGDTTSAQPTEKVSLLEKMDGLGKKPATVTSVLRNAAISAGFGAISGHFIDSHQGRSIGINAAALAGVSGLVIGLPTALITGLATNNGAKALQYGAIGFVGGAAAGGVFGAVAGQVNYLLNHALPWSPAVNGAVLGGGLSLATGVGTLISQAHKTHQAENAKNAQELKG